MLRFLLAMSAVALVSGQTENLVQLATRLGARELVRLVTEAGLAETLANKGEANGRENFRSVFYPVD